MQNKGEIVFYQTEDGVTKLSVNLQNETVWLSLDQMAELFQRDKSTISRHIKNVFEERELQPDSVVANFATTANDGKTYNVDFALTLLIAESKPEEMEIMKQIVVSVLNKGENYAIY